MSQSPRPPLAPALRRHRIGFLDRRALDEAAGRLLEDPLVDSCSIDVPNLVVEVAVTDRVVRRQLAAADWVSRFARVHRGVRYVAAAPAPPERDGPR